jgi:hypothetical protein
VDVVENGFVIRINSGAWVIGGNHKPGLVEID